MAERPLTIGGWQEVKRALDQETKLEAVGAGVSGARESSHADAGTIIQKVLETLLAGRTSVVIAHRLSPVRNADLILVIEAGRIVERDPHEELLEVKGRYFELYQRQFRSQPVRLEVVST